MQLRFLPEQRYIFILLMGVIFLIANVVVLDIILLRKLFYIPASNPVEVLPNSAQSSSCPTSCLSLINQATQAAAVKSEITPALLQTQKTASVKDIYIPLGSGSDSQNYWDPIPTAQAYVNLANYPSIKSVVFESSLSLPTGNQSVSLRLYNVTASHPVWNSDVTMNSGNTSAFLVSNPITLDSGNNLYQVQMKTQLNTPTTLQDARIHITLY